MNTTVKEELDRRACETLMLRSFQLVDEGRASAVTALFTPSGVFTVGDALNLSGEAQLRSFFDAREANTERRTRHCLTNVSCVKVNEQECELSATLLLFVLDDDSTQSPVPVQALAEVSDRYEYNADGWLIAARTTLPLAGKP